MELTHVAVRWTNTRPPPRSPHLQKSIALNQVWDQAIERPTQQQVLRILVQAAVRSLTEKPSMPHSESAEASDE